jgi:lambda family phage minor tail protein L
LPIRATGFELSGKGAIPTPVLSISNVLLLPGAIINNIGDPLGAIVTRWVTYADYLDDGATPDPDAHFIPHIYVVERKKQESRGFVEFELSASIDQQGKMLPGRQILRDTCLQTYRRFTEQDGFIYDNVTCPYTGDGYFNRLGEPVGEPSEDSCGRRLSDCRLRFGKDPLPTWAFPAIARVR